MLVEEDLNFFLLRVEIILLSYTAILYVSNYRTLICMYGAVFSEDCRAGVCVCGPNNVDVWVCVRAGARRGVYAANWGRAADRDDRSSVAH